jgi:hypothetical protein
MKLAFSHMAAKEQIIFHKVCTIIFLTILLFSCEDKSVDPAPVDNKDIFGKLSALEGVEITEIVPQNGSDRQFEINITQPVDHQNPGGATFKQRMYLSHVDENAPMALRTDGYSVSARHSSEIANIIHIYGGQDSWTACAIELTGQTSAVKIIQPGANHNLEQWLGIEINQIKKHVLPVYNFNKDIRFFSIEQLY